MDPIALRTSVRDIVESAVERLGYDLVAVEWTGNPAGRAVLRLSIDQPPGVGGGVSAGDCAKVSRAVEPLLDAADPVKGSYILEVSSPGIERPVQRLADFQRFVGYRVRVRLEPGPPRRRFTGEIAGTRDEDVLVTVDGEEHAFFVDTIERAHLDLTLEEFEALGQQGAPTIKPEDSDDHQ